MKIILKVILMLLLQYLSEQSVYNQIVADKKAQIFPEDSFQTVEGFGAALAFYEGWLTAHPNKSAIYDIIFSGLSLDILRLRNSHEYDPEMINRVSEFYQAAETSLGKPIAIMSTSWGPPARLKSNNDRSNGGTLKYTTDESGVTFDYEGFAQWWSSSLDEYNSKGIYPTYISIQNEPDFTATWESCRLNPAETINATDTIAGYNKALDFVYEAIQLLDVKPKILGPETIGIGYNAVENYGNALDLSKLYGIAHHLYHGVDQNNPYTTTTMTKVGNFHPEIPHFQTEYSLGDWFSLAGLIYKSFHDENVVAYLYWDLIWGETGGLVSLEFPWDKNQWTELQKGYIITKNYYSFKQFSYFIHPGWKRIRTSFTDNSGKCLAFLNPGKDSATFVLINPSANESYDVHLSIDGYKIISSEIFTTSDSKDCEYSGELSDSVFTVLPRSINTISMKLAESFPSGIISNDNSINSIYPNPFSENANIVFNLEKSQEIYLSVFDLQGRLIRHEYKGSFTPGNNQVIISRENLSGGIYFYRLGDLQETIAQGRFVIQEFSSY